MDSNPQNAPYEEPLNDAPYEEQRSIGENEAALLQFASREGVPPVPPGGVCRALTSDGLAEVRGVLGACTAQTLLEHVGARLSTALRPARRTEQLLGAVLCRQQRYDLKLDLRDGPVDRALSEVLSHVGSSLISVLGSGAKLFELGALVADGGCPQQPLHPDTPWSRKLSVITVVVALQVRSPRLPPYHLPLIP